MKTITLWLIAIGLVLLSGCRKDDPLKPPSNGSGTQPKTILKVKWSKLFRDSLFSASFFTPQFYSDYVVYCIESSYPDHENGIGVFNKQTGEKHPIWKDSQGCLIPDASIGTWSLSGPNHRIAVLYDHPSLFVYDIETGQQTWNYNHSGCHPSNEIYGTAFGLYHPTSNMSQNQTYLNHFHPETGQKSCIWATTMPPVYDWSEIQSVCEYETPSDANDTLHIFLNFGLSFGNNYMRSDIYAININQNKLIWLKEDVMKNGDPASFPPVIVGNKIIYQFSRGLLCMNAINGEVIWRYTQSNHFFSKISRMVYGDGKLFVNYHYGIMAFDAETGQLLWKSPEDGEIDADAGIEFYNGKVYFVNFKDWKYHLTCMDGATGTIIWQDSALYLREGLAIDQQTGNMYISDGRKIFCIDLNLTNR